MQQNFSALVDEMQENLCGDKMHIKCWGNLLQVAAFVFSSILWKKTERLIIQQLLKEDKNSARI